MRSVGGASIPTPIAIAPKGDKVARLVVNSARIEAGDVKLPREAPWRDDFIAEIKAFPQGRHDDQVDALTQLLTWNARRQALNYIQPFRYAPGFHGKVFDHGPLGP